MNFEVSGGKVYKGVGCQSLGCNWERIESQTLPRRSTTLSSISGCNWERIESMETARKRHPQFKLSILLQLGKN